MTLDWMSRSLTFCQFSCKSILVCENLAILSEIWEPIRTQVTAIATILHLRSHAIDQKSAVIEKVEPIECPIPPTISIFFRSTGAMKPAHKSITILIAEDDEEDRLLLQEAFEESKLANDLRFVRDGEELLDYLYQREGYGNPELSPRPGLILLDLNMPKKNGQEVLQEIKADPQLRPIPVVVLTTSDSPTEIERSYHLGANSFITKPVTFSGLVEVLKSLNNYWFSIVELPPDKF